MAYSEIIPKKVLHLINDFASPFYSNLFRNLQDTRVEHFIFSTYVNKRYKRLEQLTFLNHYIRHVYFPLRILKIFLFFKVFYFVLKKKIDLIHINNANIDGLNALFIQLVFKTPFITTLRNTDINTDSKIRKYILKLVIKKSNLIILKSPAFISKLDPSTHKKIKIIPNGIDDFWLNNINRKLKLSKNNNLFRIITVGDFYCNKNIDKVIKAVSKLRSEGYVLSLVIVGSQRGDCIDRFNKIINQNLSFIEYKGVLSKKDLMKEFRKSNVFCLPSKHETFGLVYIEALSQGIPIIYTKNQGVDGLVENKYSIGFNINDNNLSKLIKLSLNSSFELPEKSFFKKFSWSSIAKEIEKIYLDI